MIRNLFIICGLPGSGKSTLAKAILAGKATAHVHAEADQFRYKNGEYVFDTKDTANCHMQCQDTVRNAMESHIPDIVVSNTFSQEWERTPYHRLADEFNYRVFVIDLFDAGKDDEQLAFLNNHNVNAETIAKMRARWEK